MLVVVNPTMPQDYRETLLGDFSTIFPKFQDIDSQVDAFFSHFASIHFTWYNRYSTKVRFYLPFFNNNLTLTV